MKGSRGGGETPAPFGIGLRAAPNPFNPTTRLSFMLAGDGPVEIALFDLRGQRVCTLFDGERAAGPQAVTWDGRDAAGRPLASGVYVCRLTAGREQRVQRLALVR